MLTVYRIFRPGHPELVCDVDWPEAPGLHRIRSLLRPILDGGDPEHVTVLWKGERTDMFVDEVGGAKGLPYNEVATGIYRAASLRYRPELAESGLPFILGTAILFDRVVWY